MARDKTPLPDLSIVTICWNQKDDIEEYLDAMVQARRDCRLPIEMILVDNGSLDGTAEMVARDYPWVRVIRNDRNMGFAEGCNQGLRAATGDYLMLLNPDANAVGASLEGMLDFLRKHPSVGIVGCRLLHEDGLPQLSAYNEMSPLSYVTNHSMVYPFFEKLKKIAHQLGIGRRTRPFVCGWVMGACMMVPRRVFEEVGELESSFFIYCEDTDWCHRIRKAGYKVVHMPNLTLTHRQKGSVGRRPEFFFRRVYRSIVHYTNRQFEEPRRTWILRTMLLDMYMRLPAYRLKAMLRPGQRKAITERLRSVDRMIAIIKARDPDLFDDPPPR